MLDILACSIGSVSMKGNVIPQITVLAINAMKIFVPIILIVYGMLDLAKAVMGNDEKEMKEAQHKLIKRAVYAVVVFLIVSIVQVLFGALAGTGDENINGSSIQGCISCFVTNADKC